MTDFLTGKRMVAGKCLFLLALFLGTVVPAGFAVQPDKKFEEANASYRTGDYEHAAKLYRELSETDPGNSAYLYDLGNACVRLGRLSEAILAFEKALLIAPRDKDIRQNRDYARSLLEYRVDDNRNWYLRAAESALSRFTQTEMNFFALSFAAIFLTAAICFYVFRQTVFWGAGRRTLLVIALLASAVAFYKQARSGLVRPSIVMTKECEARYGPSAHDQVAFRMGEGIRVFLVDRREDWSRVLLTNGESGWVRNGDIEEIGQ